MFALVLSCKNILGKRSRKRMQNLYILISLGKGMAKKTGKICCCLKDELFEVVCKIEELT